MLTNQRTVRQMFSHLKPMHRLLILTLAALSASASAQNLNSSQEILSAMHDRYAKTWYRTLTFTQESVTHKPDGSTSSEIWHEALSVPGRLRIDFGDPAAGNGALFVSDHQYVYKNGKLASDKPRIHPLLVLGFDVYAQPVEKTIQQLKGLKIDLASTHEEPWKGRTMLVVGAKQGDLSSPQFWIDKERLYFVRLRQPDEHNPNATEEIDFDNYRQVEGGGWVAEHVAVYSDDKLVFEEKYSDVRINPPLEDKLFDSGKFSTRQE
jgi:outer membrane lipoprotein-sorting protein